MPQIPLGEPQQVVRGGQAVEAINPREERLLGDALSSLGGTLQKLKQENERMALNAGKEEYERESFRLLTRAQQQYQSMDTTGLSFDDFVKPQLETVKQQLKSKYKIQDANAWTGVTFGVENSLVPRFMANEAKQALEMQQQIEANRTANMAQRISEAQNPLVEMGGYFAKNTQLVDDGIANGTYLPEQRDAVLAQKNLTTLTATVDVFTSGEQRDYKKAMELVVANRNLFPGDEYGKMVSKLDGERRAWFNEGIQKEDRLRALQERQLRESQESTERLLAQRLTEAVNDPKKIVEAGKLVDVAYAEGKLTVEQRNRLLNYGTFRGELQDAFIVGSLWTDIGTGKITPIAALRKLDSPEIASRASLKERQDAKKAILGLIEEEKNRGSKLDTMYMESTKDYFKSLVMNTPQAKLKPEMAKVIIAEYDRRNADSMRKTGQPLNKFQTDALFNSAVHRYGLTVSSGRVGQQVSPTETRALRQQLRPLVQQLQQEKDPARRARLTKQIEDINAKLEAAKREAK